MGEIEVTFEEAAFGGRKVIRFQDSEGNMQSLEGQFEQELNQERQYV